MRLLSVSSALTACLVLGGTTAAQITNSKLSIGGGDSCASSGFNDPGRLSDGVTLGTATYQFTLNAGTSQLTLTVSNTSPVVVGVCNPLICDIFFNAPQGIGVSLASQSGSGGPAPNFVFTFDSDVSANPKLNTAAPFGSFSVQLHNPSGIQGCIANPLADTLPGPPGSQVIGPATFVFDLTGSLAGLTASDFTAAFSGTPPGNKPSNGAGHFQGGGVSCGASAFINNGDIEACFLVLGDDPGDGVFYGPIPENHVFPVHMLQVNRLFGMTYAANAWFSLPELSGGGQRQLAFAGPTPGQKVVVARFSVQGLMWNPDKFPTNPEQWTRALRVLVWSDGTVTSRPYGDANGMQLWVDTEVDASGTLFLSFPFVIQGL